MKYASPKVSLCRTIWIMIEDVQRRCHGIVFAELSYRKTILTAELELLVEHKKAAGYRLFAEIKTPNHFLNNLLSNIDCKSHYIRDNYPHTFHHSRNTISSRTLPVMFQINN